MLSSRLLFIDFRRCRYRQNIMTTKFMNRSIEHPRRTIILNFLEHSGIDCAYLFGQGYDRASTMSGEFHGVQAYIREKYHLAIYSHCAAHSFNLAVSVACSISEIRNCLGTVQSIYNFFNTPKRQIELHDAIQNNNTLLQKKKKT